MLCSYRKSEVHPAAVNFPMYLITPSCDSLHILPQGHFMTSKSVCRIIAGNNGGSLQGTTILLLSVAINNVSCLKTRTGMTLLKIATWPIPLHCKLHGFIKHGIVMKVLHSSFITIILIRKSAAVK